jgi:D-alanyl-D-alanine carboxypeptidase
LKPATFSERARIAVQEKLRDTGAPGASVALLVDGEQHFVEGVGYRDLARKEPLARDARFYIYSITKTMVAVAVLQLVTQGKLALDRPVQDYVHDLPMATPVTLRQLLNHRGGLPDYGALPAYNDALRAHPQQAWTPNQFLEQMLQDQLLFAPGQSWRYSNIGYLLLLMTLEAVLGAPLHAVLREQVFAPLGLPAMTVARSLEGAGSLTPGYTAFFSETGDLADMRVSYHPGWVAHRVVISTAGELARFFESHSEGALLSAAMMEAMAEPQIVPVTHPFFTQPAYGLGLMLDPQSPYGLVAGHGGGGPGYATAAFRFPNVRGHSVIAVALANRDHPELGLAIIYSLIELLAAHN